MRYGGKRFTVTELISFYEQLRGFSRSSWKLQPLPKGYAGVFAWLWAATGLEAGSGKLRVFYWRLNTLGHSSCCFTSPLSLTRTTTDAQEQERNKHQPFDHSVLNRVEPLSLSSSCTSCFLPQPSLIKKQQRERSCGEASGFHLLSLRHAEPSSH